jgi:hypothetical protein
MEGNGIVINGVSRAMVQYNVVHDVGGNSTTCGGPVGIMAYSANGVTIQYNEVYKTGPAGPKPPGACDWDGFDIDGNVSNSIVQYNYAHDNTGPGYLAYINGTWSSNTFRFNVSENDGGGFAIGGYAPTTSDLAVYNNTFYTSGDNTAGFGVGVPGGGTVTAHVMNNIFFSVGPSKPVTIADWNTVSLDGVQLLNNDYFAIGDFAIRWNGATYTSVADWTNATGQEKDGTNVKGISVDPMLTNAGHVGTLTGYPPSGLDGYRLLTASPLHGAGIDIKAKFGIDPGSTDFFAGAVPTAGGSRFNIGADGS